MTDTVTVSSTAPMAIRIHTVDPEDPTKLVPDAETFVLNGTGHTNAIGGLGITHDVPAGLLANFLAVHPHLASVLRVLAPDEFKALAEKPIQSGFEPGLQAAAASNENTARLDTSTGAAAITPDAPPADEPPPAAA